MRIARIGLLALTLLAPAFTAAPALAQERPDGLRMGVTLGGTGFVGVSFELFSGGRALDLTLSTFSFDDLSVSLVAKELFGASSFRPVVGAGLWMVVAPPADDDPEASRTGVSLLVRAPVGFDWRVSGEHYVGADLGVSRALWIRRPDPTDERPPNPRFVPLPGLSYRWDPS